MPYLVCGTPLHTQYIHGARRPHREVYHSIPETLPVLLDTVSCVGTQDGYQITRYEVSQDLRSRYHTIEYGIPDRYTEYAISSVWYTTTYSSSAWGMQAPQRGIPQYTRGSTNTSRYCILCRYSGQVSRLQIMRYLKTSDLDITPWNHGIGVGIQRMPHLVYVYTTGIRAGRPCIYGIHRMPQTSTYSTSGTIYILSWVGTQDRYPDSRYEVSQDLRSRHQTIEYGIRDRYTEYAISSEWYTTTYTVYTWACRPHREVYIVYQRQY